MTQRTRGVGARRPTAAVGGADVNVTPVLSMFTILIPFLVSMAAFSHFAVQVFRLSAAESAAAAADTSPPLLVALGTEGVLLAKGDEELGRLPGAGQGPASFAALDSALVALRSEGVAGSRVVVAAEDGVRCAALVACLDRCRGAGFDAISLADGLAEPLPTLSATEASGR
jgi:biopolymer transport protein ExbD